ncbi:MAG: hypothetical protein MJE68_27945, partial [Proteobacteria bacterium]|nr:hypothetical protein [Pseudomonadota bacterium]
TRRELLAIIQATKHSHRSVWQRIHCTNRSCSIEVPAAGTFAAIQFSTDTEKSMKMLMLSPGDPVSRMHASTALNRKPRRSK